MTTPEAVLEQLERERDALDPVAAETRARAEANAIATKASDLDNRIFTIRQSSLTIRALDGKIAGEIPLLAFLTASKATIQTEIEALPVRIRDSATLGRHQSLTISLKLIDGEPVGAGLGGFSLNTLRIGQLMKDAGFVEGPRVENQTFGELRWPGSLKDVADRIATLQLARDQEQARLDAALMTDDERAAQLAAIRAANAKPQRKTRGDGSQYDKYPDGSIVEIDTA